MRVIICGAPRAGKSTLAKTLAASTGARVHHLDMLVESHAWSEQSEIAAGYLDIQGPWIIDGCAGSRALRKWLERHPSPADKPCDRIVRLTAPLLPPSKGQATLAKGEATIWNQIRSELVARGVEIIGG